MPTLDRDRAGRFYGEVFGWRLDDHPGTGYTGITTSEDGILSGLGSLAAEAGQTSQAAGPVPYIRPGDFDAALATIERAGGEVLIPKTDVKGLRLVRSLPRSEGECDRPVAGRTWPLGRGRREHLIDRTRSGDRTERQRLSGPWSWSVAGSSVPDTE